MAARAERDLKVMLKCYSVWIVSVHVLEFAAGYVLDQVRRGRGK